MGYLLRREGARWFMVVDDSMAVALPAGTALELVRDVEPTVAVSHQKPPHDGKSARVDLVEIVTRRIAVAARREELAVKRECLWSELLATDVWRRELAWRCRVSCWRFRDLMEARSASQASVTAAPNDRVRTLDCYREQAGSSACARARWAPSLA